MSIDILAAHVRRQADNLFPKRTPSSMFLKMYGELGELIDAKTPEDKAEELADILIMLLDYGDLNNISIEDAIIKKMRKNASRKWTSNEHGVFQHVK